MSARPLVSVQGTAEQVKLPEVFSSPIRTDVVHSVHTNMAKNHRQAYAVKEKAGFMSSAASWGTGRAVSRIPRVAGGGTSRSGQGAVGNMCRGGHMFAPTKVWRRWHRHVNIKQKRYAVASALAASACAPLVAARGHNIAECEEVPLVLSADVESVTKTAKAVEALVACGAMGDVNRAKNSKQLRKGKGKMRNRRYTMRRGPLVIYDNDNGISKSFRNIPGVELANVNRLNLLQLAPGGHVGRFCVWTKGAFEKLDAIFGTAAANSTIKSGFHPPRAMMANSDLSRLINSDEIQSVVNQPKVGTKHAVLKKNPLKNLGAMIKLNPHAQTTRRQAIAAGIKKAAPAKKVKVSAAAKAAGKQRLAAMRSDSNYSGDLFDNFNAWLTGSKPSTDEE